MSDTLIPFDVSKFLKQLHAQVLEKMLEGEMDAHLGYEKNSVSAKLLNKKYGTHTESRILHLHKIFYSAFFILILIGQAI